MSNISYFLLLLGATLIAVGCGPQGNSTETVSEQNNVIEDDSIAVIVTDIFSNEFEDPDRGAWQKPDSVLSKFGRLEGKMIADIGAGAGYFTVRLADKGANVVAIDIDENFLQHIEEEALRISNGSSGSVETRITVPESPSLVADEVEGALIVNTAYFLPDRSSYFKAIFTGLKRGGKLVVVDFKPERSPVAPPDNLWISSGELVNEIEAAGFTINEIDVKTLPFQYIIVATKR